MKTSTFAALYKEYIEIGSLPESQKKKYYLIQRYKHQVSYRLLACAEDLRTEAKECFTNMLKTLLAQGSIFQKIKFDPIWSCTSTLPIPGEDVYK